MADSIPEGTSTGGWSRWQDPGSLDFYYVNDSTGETSWDEPEVWTQYITNLTNTVVDDVDGQSKGGWSRWKDPSSGDWYYSNDASGELSWDAPGPWLPQVAVPGAPSGVVSPRDAAIAAAVAEGYWANLVDLEDDIETELEGLDILRDIEDINVATYNRKRAVLLALQEVANSDDINRTVSEQ